MNNNNDFIDTIDAEESDLQTHVNLCHLRYTQLTRKLDQVDAKLAKLESSIDEVKQAVLQNQQSTEKTHLNATLYIIGILLASLGFLLAKFVII